MWLVENNNHSLFAFSSSWSSWFTVALICVRVSHEMTLYTIRCARTFVCTLNADKWVNCTTQLQLFWSFRFFFSFCRFFGKIFIRWHTLTHTQIAFTFRTEQSSLNARIWILNSNITWININNYFEWLFVADMRVVAMYFFYLFIYFFLFTVCRIISVFVSSVNRADTNTFCYRGIMLFRLDLFLVHNTMKNRSFFSQLFFFVFTKC